MLFCLAVFLVVVRGGCRLVDAGDGVPEPSWTGSGRGVAHGLGKVCFLARPCWFYRFSTSAPLMIVSSWGACGVESRGAGVGTVLLRL